MLNKKPVEKRDTEQEDVDIHSSMQQGMSNILVSVRVRPLSKKELEVDSRCLVHTLDNNLVVLLDPTADINLPEDSFRSNRSREKQYAFDMAFDKSSTQEAIFEKTTKFLIDGVANGYNATVFAYGATGAGKTHTMIGDADKPGLMLLTFEDIFACLDRLSIERQYKVRLTYLEIYNEEVRDLFTTNRISESLDIREDSIKGVTVVGLSELMVTSAKEVVNHIRNGNKRRTCEPTMANETSSRSHAVLQIIVEYKDKASGLDADIISGKLSLIDLAGSERASTTKNRGIRLLEGANINRSLLALGNCINALYENSEKGTKIFIPYRDSKLTRLLKDSLGGNCRTVMIACVSPSYGSFEDTHNTLTYANRAKNIKTNVQRNVVNVQYHISKYTAIIGQLRQEVTELRSQLKSKRNMPSMNIEKYLIVLNTHFQEEAKARKTIQQIEQSVSQLGFVTFSKQVELKSFPENSDAYIHKYNEIETLRKNVEAHEEQLRIEREKTLDLEKKRLGIENSWAKLGIEEPYLSQLQLEMKKLILSITSLDMEGKESQAQVVIEQKDQYIKLLEEQLKIRDSILEGNQELIRQSPERVAAAYHNLKSLQEISSQSIIMNPSKKRNSYHMGPIENRDYASSLPPISHSRIPRPKVASPTASTKSKESTNLPSIAKPEHPKDKYKEGRRRRYRHRIRSYSTGSSESDKSYASTYVKSEKKAQVKYALKPDRSNASPKYRRQTQYKG
ncbi:hypothetical protein SteCoe_12766 [Stentor coeruleus]|uniref:Kinesin-like protein n=1 Tax=Stentor coeruleus TaxID=5963 RepID=A0A1R2CA19_9CILI|nr:hypothetical protein SteCoe_12766 [Stentor coeruleus]